MSIRHPQEARPMALYCPRCRLRIEDGEETILIEVAYAQGDGREPQIGEETGHGHCPPRCYACGLRFSPDNGPKDKVIFVSFDDAYPYPNHGYEETRQVHAAGCPRR